MGDHLSQLGAGPTSGRPRLTGGKIDLFTFWHNRPPSGVAMRNTGAQPCPRPSVPGRFPPRIRPRSPSPRPLGERVRVRGHSPSFGMATPVGSVGSISEASSSAVTIPSPLAGEGQGEGSVTSLPGECRPRLNGTASPFRTRGRHPRQGFARQPQRLRLDPLSPWGRGSGSG